MSAFHGKDEQERHDLPAKPLRETAHGSQAVLGGPNPRVLGILTNDVAVFWLYLPPPIAQYRFVQSDEGLSSVILYLPFASVHKSAPLGAGMISAQWLAKKISAYYLRF